MLLLVAILPLGFFCFAEFNECIKNDSVPGWSRLRNAYLHMNVFEGAAAMNNTSQKNYNKAKYLIKWMKTVKIN